MSFVPLGFGLWTLGFEGGLADSFGICSRRVLYRARVHGAELCCYVIARLVVSLPFVSFVSLRLVCEDGRGRRGGGCVSVYVYAI